MGKRLIQQARGKGGPTYTSPGFRSKGRANHASYQKGNTITGKVGDLVHCSGHSGPLAEVKYENGEQIFMIAPEGIRVGDVVSCGNEAPIHAGNTLPLAAIPEGTSIFNIESNPGDGGKFVRTSGTFAKIVSKFNDRVSVLLPSKKEKSFLPACRATIGTIAGSGRTDKPFLKAGTRFHLKKATNKKYPHVCGISMNAVDHPFGGGSSSVKGRPTQSGRNYPPGRKVGKIAPRRTGRKR